MDKLIYVLWGPKDENKEARRRRLLEEVAPQLLAAGAVKLTLYIDDDQSKVRSPAPIHLGERICAEVSLWIDSVDQREPIEEILRAAGFRIAGFLVDECLYTDYGGNRHSGPRDWPDGQRSPGVMAITLMPCWMIAPSRPL